MMSAELFEFGESLGRISSRALPEVDKVLEVGAVKIKKGLNQNLYASRHFKGAGGSVTYDAKTGLGSIAYEIGPDKGRRGGALGNIAFFGTSRGGGTVDLEGPLNDEAPIVEGLLVGLVDKWSGQA